MQVCWAIVAAALVRCSLTTAVSVHRGAALLNLRQQRAKHDSAPTTEPTPSPTCNRTNHLTELPGGGVQVTMVGQSCRSFTVNVSADQRCRDDNTVTRFSAGEIFFENKKAVDVNEMYPDDNLIQMPPLDLPPGATGTCLSGVPPTLTCQIALFFDARLGENAYPKEMLPFMFEKCKAALTGYFLPALTQHDMYPLGHHDGVPQYNNCDETSQVCIDGLNVCDVNEWPQFCVPTASCAAQRAAGRVCALYQMGGPGPYHNPNDKDTVFDGSRWPQSNREPTLCIPGKYCPSLNEMYTCPAGHYCPPGVTEPYKCSFWQYCLEGSIQPLLWGPAAFCAVGDTLLIALYFLIRHNKVRAAGARKERRKSNVLGESSIPVLGVDEELREELTQGFERAHGKGEVMNFDFHELCVALPSQSRGDPGQKILANVSGRLPAGNVTAIMGPSGAGKTTLLNTLLGGSGMNGMSRSGSLSINGDEVHDITIFQKMVAYVPQDDVMMTELTVRQNINFSAKMRLPPSWTSAQIENFVGAVIEAMQLKDIQDQPIGDENRRGISGGQRKRVNVGMELVAAPLTIFLDEPTSGLDSTSALLLCDVLKFAASHFNLTVAMVVHQPRVEIWDSLDLLLLLAPGGHTVYQGKRAEAEGFFTNQHGIKFPAKSNPADVIMDAIAADARRTASAQQQDPIGPGSDSKFDSQSINFMSERWDQIWKERKAKANRPPMKSLKSKRLLTAGPSAAIHKLYGGLKTESGALHITKHFFWEFWLNHQRNLNQQYANISYIIVEVITSACTGFLIGYASPSYFRQFYASRVMTFYDPIAAVNIDLPIQNTVVSPSADVSSIAQISMLTAAAIGLSAAPPAVRLFGRDRSVSRREAERGHSRLPYYVGVDTASWYRLILSAAHFLALFSLLSKMYVPISDFVVLTFLYYYCVYGLAQIASMMFKLANAQLVGVVVTLFAAVLGGYIPDLPLWFYYINYEWWGFSSFWGMASNNYHDTYELDIAASYYGLKSRPSKTHTFLFMVAIGAIYRILSFALMVIDVQQLNARRLKDMKKVAKKLNPRRLTGPLKERFRFRKSHSLP